jgi:HD-like signal output (HDOD) protein
MSLDPNAECLSEHGIQQQRRSQRSKILETVEIPSVSPTVDRIFSLACDEDVDLDIFAQAIQEDASITARLISLANSAYFGSRKTISTVEEAIINVLGLPMVKNLAMAILLGQKFNNKECPNFSILQHWSESLVVAQTMNLIAKKSKTLDANQAYLTGLLHNIGDLLLAHLFAEHMQRTLSDMQDKSFASLADKLQNQRAHIGLDYQFSGGWLLQRLGLPDNISSAMLYLAEANEREAIKQSEQNELATLLNFVINFTFENNLNTQNNDDNSLIDCCAQLNLSPDIMIDILSEHSQRLDEASLVAQHLSAGAGK